jgi:sporulation protein YlmC with PRC-barrel domain
VHVEDVAEMRPIGILIHHNEQLMEPDDLVRLQSLLEKNYELVGKRVVTKSGKKLGTVSDYVVLSESWHVQKIHVQPSIVKMFAQGDLIIDRQQIISVSDSQVTVHDATTQTKVKKSVIDKESLLRKLKTEPATARSAQSSSSAQEN